MIPCGGDAVLHSNLPGGDMDELHHECGVAALYYLPGHTDKSPVWSGDPDELSRHMPRMLLDL